MKKLILILATSLIFTASTFAKTIPTEKKSSISFTENKGQVHDQNYKPRPDVLYCVMAGNMAVHIKNNGVSYQLNRVDTYKEVEDPKSKTIRKEIDQQTIYRIDLTWLNANTNFTRSEDEALPGYSNYYLENCPNGALKVKSYKGIILSNLYNGINLHYYEKNGELKHDYIVAPHADYKQIQLQVEGADISINKDGSLILSTPLGKVQEGAPMVFQNNQQLKAVWKIKNNTLNFEIENYNPNYELIIDPVTRIWGTYYGGNSDDYGYACANDVNGNSYMTGFTGTNTGTIIATVGSHQSLLGGGNDSFLAKFDANGNRQWATYYGGSGDDKGFSCATDAGANVYLAGTTGSSTGTVIATSVGHQAAYGGGTYDGFIVKFDASGIRQWGTYYGGSGDDYGYSCATDASGNVFLEGITTSTVGNVIASIGSHQTLYGGGFYDAYLVKFNSNGIRQWGTYYGGSTGYDSGNSCATDAIGNVYLAGWSDSNTGTVIATVGSHQPTFGGGSDAFLTKFNSNGVRQWGTYYGGIGVDYVSSCASDVNGNIYITGQTISGTGTVISTSGSHQTVFGGGSWDAFLVKFDPNGVRQWGTYYGGIGYDAGRSTITDAFGNVYMAGLTDSNAGTIIATPGSHQSVFGGGGNFDAFLVKFNSNGLRQWGTYYGGTGNDYSYACSSDATGNIYFAGQTSSNTGTIIATSSSYQSVFGGGSYDAYLVKFDVCDVAPAQPLSIAGPTAACIGIITTYSTVLAYGANSYTWSLPGAWLGSGNNNTISATPGSSGVFTLIAGNACGVSPQQTLSITVNPLPTVAVSSGSICAGQSYTITASGANTYSYSSGAVVSPSLTSTYTVMGTSSLGCLSSDISTVTVYALPTVQVNSGVICLGQTFTMVGIGASTYTYSSGAVVSPTTTTSYSVTGTSAAGCISSNTAISTVTVSSIHPTISVNSGTICMGNSFTITPSGAATYTIQGGVNVVSPATTTNYSVAGTSTAGCLSSNTAVSSVSVNPLPTVSISTTNTLICLGGSATLSASGALSYTFDPGGIVSYIMVIFPTQTSTYTLTGSNADRCSNKAMITVSVDACTDIGPLSKRDGRGLRLFPNPTTGIFNLELDSDNEVTVINAIGQIVYSSRLSSGNHQINLETLASGLYVLNVGNTVDSRSIKIVKQ